jgi:ATP adenylyltransferase
VADSMGNPLWAPWRMEYLLSKKGGPCVFCNVGAADADELRARFVVCDTPRAFVILNRYPFTAGHLLVVPHAHVSSLEDLSLEDHHALFDLVREATVRLRAAVRPDGLNVGLNLGAAAGAGIAEHMHVHIVPRWNGDTNFLPVLADTRVVPQALEATCDHLRSFFTDLPGARLPRSSNTSPEPEG